MNKKKEKVLKCSAGLIFTLESCLCQWLEGLDRKKKKKNEEEKSEEKKRRKKKKKKKKKRDTEWLDC